MKMTINGKEVVLEQPLTIADYLNAKGLDPQTVVVEYNFSVPDRRRWEEIVLNAGDNLEIVKFMGGG